jgi:hypothetical protein
VRRVSSRGVCSRNYVNQSGHGVGCTQRGTHVKRDTHIFAWYCHGR